MDCVRRAHVKPVSNHGRSSHQPRGRGRGECRLPLRHATRVSRHAVCTRTRHRRRSQIFSKHKGTAHNFSAACPTSRAGILHVHHTHQLSVSRTHITRHTAAHLCQSARLFGASEPSRLSLAALQHRERERRAPEGKGGVRAPDDRARASPRLSACGAAASAPSTARSRRTAR